MRNKPKRSIPRRGTAQLAPSRSSRSKSIASQKRQYLDEISRGLIDDVHIGVVALDASSRIEFANRAALKMFGFTKAQVIGKTSEELGITEYREDGSRIPRELRARERATESGRAVRGEVVGIRRPGVDEMLWTYGNVVPVHTNEGVLQRLIITLSDVTDRMKTRQELERSNEFNRQILMSAQEGIIVHGLDLRYQLWNPYMERMSGVKAKDVLGKHPRELFPFLEEHGGMAAMEKALAGQVTSEIDMPYEVAQNGERGWCDNQYGPLRNESGEIVGVIATVRDITGRKQHEDELHDLSSRLLQLQDEERRRIARDLHDGLAQHLMAANLNLAQLRKGAAPAGAKRSRLLADTRKIVADCSRQIRSISYLLHPPVLDELGLASAIEEYAEGFSRRTGIRVDADLQYRRGRLSREIETALFRIVQESLGNVQKHSGTETASIRLANGHDCVTLEISDRGKGIPGKDLRTYAATPHKLGVGILGMRERMRQLSGRLEISSNSQGTTVRAVLPLIGEVLYVDAHSDR
ncbi:MAG: PAS domain-containing sensor histidine kinase [Candidatus Acidiferrales bacterium]